MPLAVAGYAAALCQHLKAAVLQPESQQWETPPQ